MDAIVVGAGITGIAAATLLGERGIPTVLVGPRRAFPYDLLVSWDILAETRLDRVPGRRVDVLALNTGTRMADPDLVVCRGRDLESALLNRARTAGVRHLARRVTSVAAGKVVLSDGQALTAGRVLVTPSRLVQRDQGVTCVQPVTGHASTNEVMLHLMPGEPMTSIRVVPPARDGSATLVVTRIPYPADADPQVLIAEALEATKLTPVGRSRWHRVSSDFAAEADELLLLGNAAGLTNPFTGDGPTNALRSAHVAAEALAQGTAYTPAMTRAFTDMRTVARFARRYQLTRRVLVETAAIDAPFHVLFRRAVLLPRRTSPFRDSFVQAATDIVRATDSPFVAAVVSGKLCLTKLFAVASMAGGGPLERRWASLAAATDLVKYAIVAHTANQPDLPWSSAVTVRTGNTLLAEAARLVSRYEPELSGPFAEWIARVTREQSGVDMCAAMFEFPAYLGGRVAGVSAVTLAVLEEYGRQCGRLYAHGENLLALRGEPTRLAATREGLVRTGLATSASEDGLLVACQEAHRAAVDAVRGLGGAETLRAFANGLLAPTRCLPGLFVGEAR
jgi:hypothetical protein